MALCKKDYNHISENNTIVLYTYICINRKIIFYIIFLLNNICVMYYVKFSNFCFNFRVDLFDIYRY